MVTLYNLYSRLCTLLKLNKKRNVFLLELCPKRDFGIGIREIPAGMSFRFRDLLSWYSREFGLLLTRRRLVLWILTSTVLRIIITAIAIINNNCRRYLLLRKVIPRQQRQMPNQHYLNLIMQEPMVIFCFLNRKHSRGKEFIKCQNNKNNVNIMRWENTNE